MGINISFRPMVSGTPRVLLEDATPMSIFGIQVNKNLVLPRRGKGTSRINTWNIR